MRYYYIINMIIPKVQSLTQGRPIVDALLTEASATFIVSMSDHLALFFCFFICGADKMDLAEFPVLSGGCPREQGAFLV